MMFKHRTHSRTTPLASRQLAGIGSALAGMFVAWGCGTTPMHAAADWERGAHLEPTKSFAVARSPFLPKELTPEQSALLAIVENTTKDELRRKGYHEAAADQADLIATPSFIKRKRSDVVDASLYC